MEKKNNSAKANRILYLSVVGVLVVAALVIGLTAAFGGKNKTPTPDGENGTVQTPEDENKKPEDDPADTVPETVYGAPTTGAVVKSHDMDVPVYSITMDDYRVHQGIDIATAEGADVVAVAAGTVKQIWTDPLMGECISVDHGNGVVSIYKNLAVEKASGIVKDAEVSAGQRLGTVGETAMIECAESAHLHFEMEYNGAQVNPLSYISDESYEASLSKDTAYES